MKKKVLVSACLLGELCRYDMPRQEKVRELTFLVDKIAKWDLL